jgi:hypothetical protein
MTLVIMTLINNYTSSNDTSNNDTNNNDTYNNDTSNNDIQHNGPANCLCYCLYLFMLTVVIFSVTVLNAVAPSTRIMQDIAWKACLFEKNNKTLPAWPSLLLHSSNYWHKILYKIGP